MSGFKPPEYTQTPNNLFDDLLPELGLAELKVLLCVIRYTFGWHKDETELSIRKIARFTGLTARSVMDGAAKAEAHGLLARTVDGNKTTKWRAVVSVIPSSTPRNTKYHAGVSRSSTLSGVKERKKNKRKDAATPRTPKATDFPELVIYREVAELYPTKASWETVIGYISKVGERLGRTPTAADLKPFYVAWCNRGYLKLSVNWLEWAASGVIPANGVKRNSNDDILRDFAARRANG